MAISGDTKLAVENGLGWVDLRQSIQSGYLGPWRAQPPQTLPSVGIELLAGSILLVLKLGFSEATRLGMEHMVRNYATLICLKTTDIPRYVQGT